MNWTIYTIFSLIFIILVAGFALFQIGRLIYIRFSTEDGRAEFRGEIRGYKYGKFLWVYVLAFPLFVMSFAYSKLSAADCVFKALTDAFKLMALQFDFDLALRAADPMYNAAIILTYSVATANVVMFIVSCLNQVIWSFFGRLSFRCTKKTKCLIIGNNETSRLLYSSIDGKIVKKAIIDKMVKESKWSLFANNIFYISCSNNDKVKDNIESIIKKYNKNYKKFISNNTNGQFKKLQLIINFEKDSTNVEYCCFLIEVIKKILNEANKSNKREEDKINCLPYLDIYVYSSSEYNNLYESYIKDLHGCLHLIDKEKVIAYDFINQYPVAQYITSDQMDFDKSLINKDVKISVNFIGFSESSQKLFKSLYSNTQFVHKVNDKLEIHPVEFHVYDNKDTLEGRDFQNSFNRFKTQFIDNKNVNTNDYFEIPKLNTFIPHIGKENNVHYTKVKDEFYARLKQDKNHLHYIIVSIGNDFASIDEAKRIWNEIISNKINNCYVFVKIDDADACQKTIEAIENENNNNDKKFKDLHCQFHTFGSQKYTIYDYEKVIIDDITKFGILQGAFYKCINNKLAGYLNTEEFNKVNYLDLPEDVVDTERDDWSTNSEREYGRYSNINAALNLRTKLLLMGLDYIPADDDSKPALFETFEQYWAYLDKLSKPKLSFIEHVDIKDKWSEKDKKAASKQNQNAENINNKIKEGSALCLEYSLTHIENSRRWTLINIEHNRWNSFMVATGYVPLEISNIKLGSKGHKDINNMKQACITSMSGLTDLDIYLSILNVASVTNKQYSSFEEKKIDFNALPVETQNLLKLSFDKINYDYLQYDCAWHVLKAVKYKIVYSDNNPEYIKLLEKQKKQQEQQNA